MRACCGCDYHFASVDNAIAGLEHGPTLWPALRSYWEHREKPNCLLFSYIDLQKDLPGAVWKIAKFIGVEITPELHAKIVHSASFAEMKKNEHRFDAQTIGPIVDGERIFPLMPGTMFRKGKVHGGQDASEVTEEQKKKIEAVD